MKRNEFLEKDNVRLKEKFETIELKFTAYQTSACKQKELSEIESVKDKNGLGFKNDPKKREPITALTLNSKIGSSTYNKSTLDFDNELDVSVKPKLDKKCDEKSSKKQGKEKVDNEEWFELETIVDSDDEETLGVERVS
ncbi:hypothetical protein E9993_23520, partial [Labilibacter sediminis]